MAKEQDFMKMSKEEQKKITDAACALMGIVATFLKKLKSDGKIRTLDEGIEYIESLGIVFSEPRFIKYVFKADKLEKELDQIIKSTKEAKTHG
jgi:hypothetical protein